MRDWRSQAACLGRPPEWWEADCARDLATVQLAVSICERCRVRRECLEDQLAWERGRGERYLIFGGLTPSERERYARWLRRRSA